MELIAVVRIADLETGPFWKHMNMEIVTRDDDTKVVKLTITEELKQYYGNIHGGAIASLMDSAIAIAVNQQLDPEEGASTIEMKLNYLRPASQGALWGEGRIIQKGRKIIVGQAEIKNDEGQLVAVGTASFMVYKMSSQN